MPLLKIQLRPGINRDSTNYSNEYGWRACDKVRFYSGFPQKIGGWVKLTPNEFYGVCRQLWNWVTTFGDNLLALGTHNKLYIEVAGYLYDITPLRATDPILITPATDNCVETVSGSNTVRINLPSAHGAETGSFVVISGVTGDVGGLPNSQINGSHQITVIDANSFSFEVTSDAGSSDPSGGGTTISISFEIAPGNAYNAFGYGWGVGSWGRDAWGLGASGTPVLLPQRDWWLDNFDNDLVANIRNGAVYWWERGTLADPSTALETKAVSLQSLATAASFDPNSVPAKVGQILVSQQDKHLIAFGAVPFGSTDPDDFDPLLIRWADQDNPFQWTPEVTNSASFLRVSRGSAIVRAIPARQEILVFTDSSLYTLQFLGTTDVFGLQEYDSNISIISPRAVVTARNIVFWMGKDKFYSYSGRVDTLPCTLREYVFGDIGLDQTDQIVCGTNEAWNEVWWFYPSRNSSFNDRYVVYNYVEQAWYYGTIDRTAWLDSALRGYPQAAFTEFSTDMDVKGNLYQHEYGIDADTAAMPAYVESSDMDLEDGYQYMLIRRIIPDVDFSQSTDPNATMFMEVRPRLFPGSAYLADSADTQPVISTSIGQFTDQVFIRARARQMAIKLSSTGMGVQWRLGSPRVDMRPDGRR